MYSSPPGSSVHGILQARILEWVAISFSRDFPYQGPSWPGIEPRSSALQADALPSELVGKPSRQRDRPQAKALTLEEVPSLCVVEKEWEGRLAMAQTLQGLTTFCNFYLKGNGKSLKGLHLYLKKIIRADLMFYMYSVSFYPTVQLARLDLFCMVTWGSSEPPWRLHGFSLTLKRKIRTNSFPRWNEQSTRDCITSVLDAVWGWGVPRIKNSQILGLHYNYPGSFDIYLFTYWAGNPFPWYKFNWYQKRPRRNLPPIPVPWYPVFLPVARFVCVSPRTWVCANTCLYIFSHTYFSVFTDGNML